MSSLPTPKVGLRLARPPTTPDRIFIGLRAAVEVASDSLGLTIAEVLARADLFIYGTTRATNAIVTGITTLGLISASSIRACRLKRGL